MRTLFAILAVGILYGCGSGGGGASVVTTHQWTGNWSDLSNSGEGGKIGLSTYSDNTFSSLAHDDNVTHTTAQLAGAWPMNGQQWTAELPDGLSYTSTDVLSTDSRGHLVGDLHLARGGALKAIWRVDLVSVF